MYKLISVIITAVFFIKLQAQTANLAGNWQGNLNAGKELNIIFHFTKAGDSYTGTMDVPAQNAKDLPLSKVIVTADSMVAEMAAANITYKGVLVNNSTLVGKWMQNGASVPLKLSRFVTAETNAVKPQTPVPPFSYNSEDVEYGNADKSVHFGATLTYPKTGDNFPVALLITGSGQQDRDETIFGHKPFAVLADYLTKKGYAVLRVDDRGVGKTTGSLAHVTSADFAADVEAGIAYLKTRPEINKNKMGLIGHSEGGVIAPMVAAKHPEMDFIVMWAGPVIGGLATNTSQNVFSLAKAGINAEAVNAFESLHTAELELFGHAENTAVLNKRAKQVYDDWKKKQSPGILTALYAGDSTIVGKTIYDIYDGLYNNYWMRYFITHNFEEDLAKVHCKVLAINGDKDTQVDAVENLHAVDSILAKNKNPHYKTVKLPGLNHLLQPAVTGDISEYATIPTTIEPFALKTIGDWLDENVAGKK